MNKMKWLSIPASLAMAATLLVSPMNVMASSSDTSLPATIAFDREEYSVGDHPTIVGTLDVNAIKQQIAGYAAMASKAKLSNVKSTFTAIATVPEELVPAFTGAGLANANFESSGNLFYLSDVSFDPATRELKGVMELLPSFKPATFNDLLAGVQAENDTLVLSVTAPNAYMPMAVNETFATTWKIDGKELPSGSVLERKIGDKVKIEGFNVDDLVTKFTEATKNMDKTQTGTLSISVEGFGDVDPTSETMTLEQALEAVTVFANELKSAESETVEVTKEDADLGGLATKLSVSFTPDTKQTLTVSGKVVGSFSANVNDSEQPIAFEWPSTVPDDTANFGLSGLTFTSEYNLGFKFAMERPSKTPKTATAVNWVSSSLMGVAALAGLAILKKRM